MDDDEKENLRNIISLLMVILTLPISIPSFFIHYGYCYGAKLSNKIQKAWLEE